MFIDTHCHLFKEYYEDIGQILDNADAKNINKFMVAATDIPTCHEIIKLASSFANVYICLGIHPEAIDSDYHEINDIIVQTYGNKQFVAIGEIGLDYHYGKEKSEEQKQLFHQMLALAEQYNLPVVVHSRDATQDTLDILKEHHVKGVIHSFNGSYEVAQEYLKLGFKLGINGVITFKNCKLKEVIRRLPLSAIVLETDSPYLTPVPYRGQSNEPANIAVIAQFVADLYGISLEDVAKATTRNAKDIFDI